MTNFHQGQTDSPGRISYKEVLQLFYQVRIDCKFFNEFLNNHIQPLGSEFPVLMTERLGFWKDLENASNHQFLFFLQCFPPFKSQLFIHIYFATCKRFQADFSWFSSWFKILSFGKALITESCFRHPLYDLRATRKVEIRHTNFHFSSKKVTSKSWSFWPDNCQKTFHFST